MTFGCCVIGAGAVGLAVAREVSRAGLEVLVIEAASQIGTGISSRNSEVIHAGIYYAPNSLKARFCVEGKKALFSYCDSKKINARRVGKLIVATHPSQLETLADLAQRAAQNGVRDIQFINGSENVRKLEPEVTACAALFSPSTGIIDSHALMLSLRRDAEDSGATFSMNTIVEKGELLKGSGAPWSITTKDKASGQQFCVTSRSVVNCAGLAASHVAAAFMDGTANAPQTFFAKGNYFKLMAPSPFTHLVYPVPEAGGLGVHATIDLGGEVRFGPDVEWVENPNDFSVNPARADGFYAEIRRYWPRLLDSSLAPDYCGIRPKLIDQKSANAADFLIQSTRDHGFPGLVNLIGIESPGLTSCLAIGRYVADFVVTEFSR